MLNKFRTNYNLSLLIVRILFVLTFLFCNWQNLLSATNMVISMTEGVSTDIVLPMMFLSGIISAVILMLLIPFLTNFFLNYMRLYNIPRAEYVLLVLAFFVIGFFACGLLNLVNFFTPLLLTWGGVLFPFLVSLGCAIGFYKVTANLYFNDVTKPNYFKGLAILYVVGVVILGVIA